MSFEHNATSTDDPFIGATQPEPTDWIDALLKEAYAKAQDPPPIRLADILHEIVSTLAHYLYFPHPATAMLIACWIAMTYCFREFKYAGYVAIRSEAPGSGKTRLLELSSSLTAGNPPVYTNPTGPVLFRAVQNVFLIDEVDRLRAQDAQTYGQVLSILNAGFAANGVVPRAEREGNSTKFTVVNYPVFSPKAFAGLEKLDPTLADRSFYVSMTKAPQRLPRLSQRVFDDMARRIRKELETWCTDHREQIKQAYDTLPIELPVLRRYDDRYQDIAEPLIVLAALADAEYGGAQQIMRPLLEGLRISASERSPGGRERIAAALQEILLPVLGNSESMFIPSKQILAHVQAGGLTWIDSTVDLANTLGPLGLQPRSNGKLHGYDVTQEWLLNLSKSRQ
ncbi:MAG: DUF3631 domain-containing protein [Nitrospira sp.]|nr:DUF3631 domain-containing protein [Nitrospira sp.]